MEAKQIDPSPALVPSGLHNQNQNNTKQEKIKYLGLQCSQNQTNPAISKDVALL